jgi:hypothetical protein
MQRQRVEHYTKNKKCSPRITRQSAAEKAVRLEVLSSSTTIRAGSYTTGVVELTVPFQQYLLKQSTQTAGTSVLVRLKLRERIAHPRQAGH